MNPRELSPQEVFHQKLKVLVPDAICNIRPFDNNAHLAKNPIIRGDFLVDWELSNPGACPTVQQVEAVTPQQVSAKAEVDRKKDRDKVKADDLSLVGCYELEKKSNPNLKFSEYLDSLEGKKPKDNAIIPTI